MTSLSDSLVVDGGITNNAKNYGSGDITDPNKTVTVPLQELNVLIEAQIKTAVARLASAFEQELRKLETRLDSTLRSQSELVGQDMRRLEHRVVGLETGSGTNGVGAEQNRRVMDTLNVLDGKVELLSDIVHSEGREPVKEVVLQCWKQNKDEWKEETFSFFETALRTCRAEVEDVDFR